MNCIYKQDSQCLWAFLLAVVFVATPLQGQSFTQVDAIDKLYTPNSNYSGAAWIDMDNDGDLDLFVTKGFLFRNDGAGAFTRVNTIIGTNQANQNGNGVSCADYDNDGDIDISLAGSPSTIYTNDGSGNFTALQPIPTPIYGWACAWGDYDNDGFTDIVYTNPAAPFVTQTQPCYLLRNNRNGGFEAITSFEFTQIGSIPYTVPTWSDFDGDGDLDLFIGSGPANGTTAPDYLYENTLAQTGSAELAIMQRAPLTTDWQDGQVWNWIDFDNDGDLDAYLTNYSGAPNRMYLNYNGTYVSQINETTYNSQALSNLWADFDNDGDLDLLTTNENKATQYFRNENGNLTAISNAITTAAGSFKISAVAGDYDNDGDLDVYISGASGRGLFRNDTEPQNHWVRFALVGTQSNKSAIGAVVHIRAVIRGTAVWQQRSISAQNSFNGHSSLRAHFGLGDATNLDSILIRWPSGHIETFSPVSVNAQHTLVEGSGTVVSVAEKNSPQYKLVLHPSPQQHTLAVEIPNQTVRLVLFNSRGQAVYQKQPLLGTTMLSIPTHSLPCGIYILSAELHNGEQLGETILLR